ncbi:MAG TPA: hypothetical protein VHD35_03890 [Chitinophagaceae bacterium]|nr:hypothetical protein [Chitinophagaceae bacterium]
MTQDLKVEDIDGKMSWLEVMKTYKPDITEEEAEYILWEETCYPFDDETTLERIKTFFTKDNL